MMSSEVRIPGVTTAEGSERGCPQPQQDHYALLPEHAECQAKADVLRLRTVQLKQAPMLMAMVCSFLSENCSCTIRRIPYNRVQLKVRLK
jgi:hypothetical protein